MSFISQCMIRVLADIIIAAVVVAIIAPITIVTLYTS